MSKQFQAITNSIIGILAFLFIAVMGMSVFAICDDLKAYDISEDSMIYALQYNRYSDLVRYYHRNQALGVHSTKTMEECCAIARYYEAAIDYKLAIQENDPKLQKKSEETMEMAADEMGDFSYAKDEIDTLLGIFL